MPPIKHDEGMGDADELVLTTSQAYEAAFRFVFQYRLRERIPGPESLDLMLVHMEPVGDQARTSDPAAWPDWEECVRQTLRSDPLPGFESS